MSAGFTALCNWGALRKNEKHYDINKPMVLGAITPALSPTGDHPMPTDRYSWLGHSIGEIVGRLFTDPFSIIKVVMIDYEGIIYT